MPKLLPLNAGRVSARELRRRLNNQTEFTEEKLVPAVGQLLNNERIMQDKIAALEAFHAMTFWRRLRWLVRGAR